MTLVSTVASARLRAVFLVFFLSLTVVMPALANRVVIDQLGNKVTIPDKVTRAVVLEHHTLDVIVQLGAEEQVVGVMRNWQQLLGAGFERLAPEFKSLPQPGGLTQVNTEELLSLHPDVVFVTHYAPERMLRQIKSVGIPVIQMAFFAGPEGEEDQLNPSLENAKRAYFVGLIEAVKLIGKVFGKQHRAEELIDVIVASRQLINERTANLPKAKRIPIYMANPNLHTYGSDKYTGVVMKLAGGLNVARELNGYSQVTMEQILAWNPAVIIVQHRYRQVADQIRQDPAWQGVRAVRNNRIYVTPPYVKPWGHPVPESVALGEFWMAKLLHPELFEDIDLEAKVQAYYRKFYGTKYVAE